MISLFDLRVHFVCLISTPDIVGRIRFYGKTISRELFHAKKGLFALNYGTIQLQNENRLELISHFFLVNYASLSRKN